MRGYRGVGRRSRGWGNIVKLPKIGLGRPSPEKNTDPRMLNIVFIQTANLTASLRNIETSHDKQILLMLNGKMTIAFNVAKHLNSLYSCCLLHLVTHRIRASLMCIVIWVFFICYK